MPGEATVTFIYNPDTGRCVPRGTNPGAPLPITSQPNSEQSLARVDLGQDGAEGSERALDLDQDGDQDLGHPLIDGAEVLDRLGHTTGELAEVMDKVIAYHDAKRRGAQVAAAGLRQQRNVYAEDSAKRLEAFDTTHQRVIEERDRVADATRARDWAQGECDELNTKLTDALHTSTAGLQSSEELLAQGQRSKEQAIALLTEGRDSLTALLDGTFQLGDGTLTSAGDLVEAIQQADKVLARQENLLLLRQNALGQEEGLLSQLVIDTSELNEVLTQMIAEFRLGLARQEVADAFGNDYLINGSLIKAILAARKTAREHKIEERQRGVDPLEQDSVKGNGRIQSIAQWCREHIPERFALRIGTGNENNLPALEEGGNI